MARRQSLGPGTAPTSCPRCRRNRWPRRGGCTGSRTRRTSAATRAAATASTRPPAEFSVSYLSDDRLAVFAETYAEGTRVLGKSEADRCRSRVWSTRALRLLRIDKMAVAAAFGLDNRISTEKPYPRTQAWSAAGTPGTRGSTAWLVFLGRKSAPHRNLCLYLDRCADALAFETEGMLAELREDGLRLPEVPDHPRALLLARSARPGRAARVGSTTVRRHAVAVSTRSGVETPHTPHAAPWPESAAPARASIRHGRRAPPAITRPSCERTPMPHPDGAGHPGARPVRRHHRRARRPGGHARARPARRARARPQRAPRDRPRRRSSGSPAC